MLAAKDSARDNARMNVVIRMERIRKFSRIAWAAGLGAILAFKINNGYGACLYGYRLQHRGSLAGGSICHLSLLFWFLLTLGTMMSVFRLTVLVATIL